MVRKIALGCVALFLVSLVAEVASAQLFGFRRRAQCSTGQCNVLAYQEPTISVEQVLAAADGSLRLNTIWHGKDFKQFSDGRWETNQLKGSRVVKTKQRRFTELRHLPSHPRTRAPILRVASR